MIHILVPMAGRGRRFAEWGFAMPKPLIPIHGIPMVELVTANLRLDRPHRFCFLALQEHLENWGLRDLLRRLAPGAVVIPVTDVTEGAACTALLARNYIDSPDPLVIANCDQWVDANFEDFVDRLVQGGSDGLIMTMRASDPRWSFVEFDSEGSVARVVEKEVVSNEATVGIYGFRRGCDFVRAADAMIARNARVRGEFYLAPVYNELIAEGRKIDVRSVGRLDEGMHGLGAPEDVARFLRRPISRAAAAGARAS